MNPRSVLQSVAFLAALVAPPLGAIPTVPALVNYQGYATTAAGVALADGNYDVLFKIYTAASGGTPIWGEKQVVTLNGGQFSVLLGNGSAVDGVIPHGLLTDLFGTSGTASGDLFIGLTVNIVGQTTAAEFAPRQQLLANPFAHRAKRADVATTVVDAAIGTTALASGSISTVKVADNAITGTKILDGTVASAELADNAVTNAKLADAAVSTAELAGNAVTDVKIAASAVTTAKLAAGAVTSAIIADGTVATVDLADGAVTAGKLAAGAISSALLADGSVGTSKLANLAVTEAKIADASVTGAKIVNETVTADDVSFADGTSTLNLYPSSGTTGTYLSMTSTAVTARSAVATAYPFRWANGANICGLHIVGPGLMQMAASISDAGVVQGGAATLTIGGAWVTSSDERLKKDVQPAEGLLEKALNLRPVRFRFKTQAETEPETLGFIAQEVDKQLPCLVNKDSEFLSLNYPGLSTVAIGAVQEQQGLIEKQNKRIARLEADNAALAQRLDRMEAALKGQAAK